MTFPHFHLIKRTISSVDSPDPYLMRWEWNTPWFTMKLHRFLRSDQAPLHDHPWWFISFVLWGGYEEYLARNPCETHCPRLVRRRPLSLAFRRATDRHRVDLGQRRQVWTLVLTGSKKREWAFYPIHRSLNPSTIEIVRVPWRVAINLGENHVQHLVNGGHREDFFEELNRGFIKKEAEAA